LQKKAMVITMNKQIFDDFPTAECNECESYWNNQCDGVTPSSKAQNDTCKAFVPIRRVSIPQQIESLKKEVNTLRWCLVLVEVVMLLHVLSHIWR
jgi:hypothetical protein